MSDFDNDQLPFLDSQQLDCFDIELLLDAYTSNDLLPLLYSKFEEHLSSCNRCKHLVQDIQHLLQDARKLADMPIPRGARERLRQALKDKVGYEDPSTCSSPGNDKL